MIATEEEAKKKWCPHVRESTHRGGAYNRNSGGSDTTWNNCLASDCMMWREESSVAPKRGYCGLVT